MTTIIMTAIITTVIMTTVIMTVMTTVIFMAILMTMADILARAASSSSAATYRWLVAGPGGAGGKLE